MSSKLCQQLPPAPIAETVEAFVHMCGQCGNEFDNEQQLGVHVASRLNSCTSPLMSLRQEIGRSGGRLACMLVYADRRRLIEHLSEKSQVCRQYYTTHLLDVETVAWRVIETEDRELARQCKKSGSRRTVAESHVLKLNGPTPKPDVDHTSRHLLGPSRRFHYS